MCGNCRNQKCNRKPPKTQCEINWKYSMHSVSSSCSLLIIKIHENNSHKYESYRKGKINNSCIKM